MLDKQIYSLEVDTGDFYSNHELELNNKINKLKAEKKVLEKKLEKYKKAFKIKITPKLYDTVINDNAICFDDSYISKYRSLLSADMIFRIDLYLKIKNVYLIMKKNRIVKNNTALRKLLRNKSEQNIIANGKDHIRELKSERVFRESGELRQNNVVSVFDSFLTRIMGCEEDETTFNFITVRVYFFDVIKDMIYYGFVFGGEKYIYFTSSAGQIRKKKCVFIKEKIWEENKKTLMCGLTLDEINNTGGHNSNKYLAYLSLNNSATDVWKEFNIDKSIVVDDFETDVEGDFDSIDITTYEITRKHDYVNIPHMDGCGIMMPIVGGKIMTNRMIRAPWFKGLLGIFDFQKFIIKNRCSPVIKDIYGKEYDVMADDIEVIFTKSQFKMWNHYKSWDEYKTYFKKYKCTMNYCKPEDEYIYNSKINYQMLQTFTDYTEFELNKVTKYSMEKLRNVFTELNSCLEFLGATEKNKNKTSLQKCIEIYPSLINDIHIKQKLKDMKDAAIKGYRGGKINVDGKFTFILPDLYAFCEWLFLKIENPRGLLRSDEVYCNLFTSSPKLDVLRSPHLYKEHCVRKNKACVTREEIELDRMAESSKSMCREWFTTHAVYISTHDLISKVLQCDVDGDIALVIKDRYIIGLAEKNTKDVVPLVYDMKKALPCILSNETIYDGLQAAFIGSNIGIYSNAISKIWNSGVFRTGTEKEKNEAVNAVKWLVMENNFKIDYAKTLFMPKRPKYADDIIKKYTKGKLPHFFIYAKDKEESQVEPVNNSFVNQFERRFPRVTFSVKRFNLEKINYKLLMHNPSRISETIHKDEIDGSKRVYESHPVIQEYSRISRTFGYQASKYILNNRYNVPYDLMTKAEKKQKYIYSQLIKQIRGHLSKVGNSEFQITDILVKYLYFYKHTARKDILWMCYGDVIYTNLMYNLHNIIVRKCNCCGKWVKLDKDDSGRYYLCEDCKYYFGKRRRAYSSKKALVKRQSLIASEDEQNIK